jgi:ribosomal protein S18 acetylase RimI-like enzyme
MTPIRPATTADAPLIAQHRKRMWEDAGNLGEPSLDAMLQPFIEWATQRIVTGEYRHWFALNEHHEVIGGGGVWYMDFPVGLFDLSGKRGHILNIYTEPAYRGQGIAKHLMELCIADCRAEKCGTITLNATAQGRPIYERLGFADSPTFMILRL